VSHEAEREDLAGVAGEVEEELELAAGEADLGVVADHALPGDVDHERAEDQRRLGHACVGQRLPAPEERADAGLQLAEAERLGEVVVGAELEADHAVELGRLGGEHEHEELGPAHAHPPADLEPVHAGQHEVEDDQRDLGIERGLEAVGAVAGHDHVVPHVAERASDERGDVAVVLDDQYEGAVHGVSVAWGWSRGDHGGARVGVLGRIVCDEPASGRWTVLESQRRVDDGDRHLRNDSGPGGRSKSKGTAVFGEVHSADPCIMPA
jgi:hypothetical protein